MADQNDYRSVPVLFQSKGIVARVAPDRAPDYTYINLNNCYEREEEALSSRFGNELINRDPDGTPSGVNYPFPTLPSTIARLKSLSGNVYRYVGSGANLYRRAGDAQGQFTNIVGGLSGNPFTAIVTTCFQSAQPFLFIADRSEMIKDSGTGTPSQWGINPPTFVDNTEVYAPTYTLIESFTVASGFTHTGLTVGSVSTTATVNGVNGTSELAGDHEQYLCVDGSCRTAQSGMLGQSATLAGVATLVEVFNPFGVFNFAQITLTAASPFAIGTHVTFSGFTTATWLNGQTVTLISLFFSPPGPNQIQFVATGMPPAPYSVADSGTVIAAGAILIFDILQDTSEFSVATNATGLFATTDSFTFKQLAATVPSNAASTIGKSVNLNLAGYSTDDLFVLAIKIGSPEALQEVRLQFDVDGSGYTSAYYYKSIVPASFQSGISIPQSMDPSQAVVSAVAARALGITNLLGIGQDFTQLIPTDDPSIGQLQPSQLTTGDDSWTVLYLRKGDFLPVGNAGSPGLDWSRITGWQVQITTNTEGSTTVAFNSLYIQGSYGPSAFGGIGYDYRYTYHNANTGTESNPCQRQYFFSNPSLGFEAPDVGSDNPVGGGTIAWTNPGNITSPTGGTADVTLTTGQQSHLLQATQFNFNVPPGNLITGILVEYEAVTTDTVAQAQFKLMLAGVTQNASARFVNPPTGSLAFKLEGGKGDLWGLTLTPADINNSGFGLSIEMFGALGGTTNFKYVQITVYTAAPNSSGISDVIPLRQAINITGRNSSDPQVTHIKIYRRGGTLSTGWRLVDRITNTTGTGTWSYKDTFSDATLQEAPLLLLDNDAPVTSTLQVPVNTTLQVAVDPVKPYGDLIVQVFGSDVFLTGQIIAIGTPENLELVYATIGGTGLFHATVQLPHAAGEPVQSFSYPSRPTYLGALAYNRMWLAGDVNNPHILYFSKGAFPENFPPQNYIPISSPADPITAVINFRGTLFVSTISTWYQIFPGDPPYAQTTGSKHGCVAPFGFTVTETAIWYQAIDGIRQFRGAEGIYQSLSIEWIFQNGPALSPIPYLDTTQIAKTVMALWNNQVTICYKAKDSNYYRLTWDARVGRWRNDSVHANFIYTETDTNTLVYTAPITGGYGLFEDNIGDSDDSGWVAGVVTPVPIAVDLQTPYGDQGAPNNQKQYNVVTVDANPNGGTFTVQLYFDDSGTISPLTLGTFTGSTRKKFQFKVNNGLGQQAYRVSLRITGNVTVAPIFYQADYHFALLVEQRASFDSYWAKLSTGDESKIVKQGYFDYTASDPVNVSIYADGSIVPYYTFVLPASPNRTGVPIRVRFPALKLRLFRLVANTSVTGGSFQWWESPQLDVKGVVAGKTYARHELTTT